MRTDNLEFIWDGWQRFIIRQPGPSIDDGRLELFAGDGGESEERKLIDAFDVPQQRNWIRMFQLPQGTRSLVLTSRSETETVVIRLADTIGPPRDGSRPMRRVFVAEAWDATAGQQAFEFKSLRKAALEIGLNQIVEVYQSSARAKGRHPFWWLTYDEMESKVNGVRELELTPATSVSGDASLSLLCEYVRPESPRREALDAPSALALHAMRELPCTPGLRVWADHGGEIPEEVRAGLLFFHIHNQLIDLDEAGKVDTAQEVDVTISHEVASALMRIPTEIVTKLAPASGVHKAFLDQALADGTARTTRANPPGAPVQATVKPRSLGQVIEYDFFIACYGDEIGVVSGKDVTISPVEDQTRPSRAVAYRVVNGRDILARRAAGEQPLKGLISEAVGRVYMLEEPSDFSVGDGTDASDTSSVARAATGWLRSLRERIAAVIGDADMSRDLGLPDRFQGFDALGMTAYAQCVERAGAWLRGRTLDPTLPAFLTFAAFRNDPVLCAFLCDNAEPGGAALQLERPVRRATDKHPAGRIVEFFGQGEILPPPTDEGGQGNSLDWLRNYDLLEKLRASNVTIEDYSNDSAFADLKKYILPLLGSADELRKHRAQVERRGRARTASLLGNYAEMRTAKRALTLERLVQTAREIKESDEVYETDSKRLSAIIDRRISVPGQPRRPTEAATVDEARERLAELIRKICANPQVDQLLKDELAAIDVRALDLNGAADNYEKLLNLESDQQALTFVEVVAALESWAHLPSFVHGLPPGLDEAVDEDQDSRARLAKWLENAQRGLPKQQSAPATYLSEAETQIVARLTTRIGRPSLRAFDDHNYKDLLALSRILVFHRGFEALRQLSSQLAQAERSHYVTSMHADIARLRRFLYCWPSRATDAWKLAEELADRSPDISIEQLRAGVDPSTFDLQ